MSLLVYFMAKELAAIGGTNYLSTLTGTGTGYLQTDAMALAGTMSLDHLDAAELTVYFNNANAAGAALPSNIQTLIDAVKCLENTPPGQLQTEYLLLLCKLGVHKAYPQ